MGQVKNGKQKILRPLYQTCNIRDCNPMKGKVILLETEWNETT